MEFEEQLRLTVYTTPIMMPDNGHIVKNNKKFLILF